LLKTPLDVVERTKTYNQTIGTLRRSKPVGRGAQRDGPAMAWMAEKP